MPGKRKTAKGKTVYNRMSRHELLAGFLCGLLPFVLLLPIKLWIATLFPLLTFFPALPIDEAAPTRIYG